MWIVAVKTLLSDRGKLLTALVGVVFSIVLVNVQGGLFLGLIHKASLLVDQTDADIWVGHRRMTNVDFPQSIPRRWGQRIRGIAGVVDAQPYLIGHSVMTLPDGGFEPVVVVGCDPDTFRGAPNPAFGVEPSVLRDADAVIVDRADAHKIGNPQIGDLREVGRRRARIAGFSDGLLGFLVTPYVFTTWDRAADFLHVSADETSYFLVKTADGVDPTAVCRSIQQRLPEVEAYTRQQFASVSIAYWLRRTGIGISFGAATILGLIVGLVIVAQTLYASVLDRLTEFATLKAIGAAEGQIYSVVLNQALLLASLGCTMGLACVAVVQGCFSSPRAPIDIPWPVALGSVMLVTAICLASSLWPYWRVRRTDAAIVLQN